MKKLNKKGFTLIELLAVIVILAIVAAVTMTVVVPMINEQPKKAAESSTRNMVNQIMGACQDTLTSEIMAPSHGTFAGTVTSPASGTASDCATGTCTISFSSTNLKDMNISGEMPKTFTATMTKCNMSTATVEFEDGQFDGITVALGADGKYTTTK